MFVHKLNVSGCRIPDAPVCFHVQRRVAFHGLPYQVPVFPNNLSVENLDVFLPSPRILMLVCIFFTCWGNVPVGCFYDYSLVRRVTWAEDTVLEA